MTWTKDIIKLMASIAICFCAGAIGSIFTAPAIPTWYVALEKPPFTPPNWLFAPAWTTLYLLMAISAFIIWRRGLDNRQGKIALIIFLVQLVLNALWSVVFFGLELHQGAVGEIAYHQSGEIRQAGPGTDSSKLVGLINDLGRRFWIVERHGFEHRHVNGIFLLNIKSP